MLHRWTTALLLLATAGTARAQEAPEHLLPAGTQVYLRWDGLAAHRAAHARTALGQMLQGDTGRFLDGLVVQLQDLLGSLLTVENLLKGVPPERLQQFQADAAVAPKLLEILGRHGLLLAVEVRGLRPPAVQLTLVLPDAGAESAPLFATLHLLAGLAGAELKDLPLAGRVVHHVQDGPVHAAWWVEGKHALVSVGTDHPEAVLRRLQGREPRLTDNPLFKKVQGFHRFETGVRAFADLAALARLAQSYGKEAAQLVTGLGLDMVKSWTYYSGFEGEVTRNVSELELSGLRRGLLRLVGGRPFRLKDLPPLPPDAAGWSATNFNTDLLYDTALQAALNITALASPKDVPQVRAFFKEVDAALGVSLRDDLLGVLGDRFVNYASPAEGPFVFGQTVLFRVKDGKKFQAALGKAAKALAKEAGVSATVRKLRFRGVEIHQVYVRAQGFFLVPTYAVHGDWFVLSLFPQAVHGFVLRALGELPAWQPEAHVRTALDQMPQEFVSIAVSDPRPGLRQLLAVAPLAAGGLKSFLPDEKFEVGLIPNAHEATRYLFPNVSVLTDEGTTLRGETWASLVLPLPIDPSSLDLQTLLLLFGLGRLF